MTTIAIAHGVVAFDSRVTDGEDGMILLGAVNKCWVGKRHPVVYCGHGDVNRWYQVARWLESRAKLPWHEKTWKVPKDYPPLGDDAGLFVVERDGTIYSFEDNGWYCMASKIATAGSGSKAAHGAMLAGAPADEAVHIAIELDSYSGPPVNVIRLEDLPNGSAAPSAGPATNAGRGRPLHPAQKVRGPQKHRLGQQPGSGRVAARRKR